MQIKKNFCLHMSRHIVAGAFIGASLIPLPVVAATQSAILRRLAQAENGALTVVARDGVTSEQPSIGKLDLGAVDSLSTPKVEKDFILRNDRQIPLTIGRLQPTCGCTSVLLGDKNETAKTLAPGEEVKVRVSIDVSRFRGPIHKAVRAYAADGATLLATMEVDANIQEAVTFSTRQVNFGQVNFGGEASLPLEITLSPRLTNNAPQLVSNTPNVIVTAVKEATATPNAVRRYQVALSKQAPIGPLNATLSLALPKKDGSAPTEEEKLISDALQSSNVIVMGEVVGKLSVTPRMVIFGNKQSSQQVTINGVAPAQFKKVKAVSASPFIKTRWITSKSASTASSDVSVPVLQLELSPKAPVGALETNITITAPDGESLVLPVLADVGPPAGAPR